MDWLTSLQKASHYSGIGRYDLAEKELRQALVEAPDNSLLHCELGWTLKKKGDSQQAEVEARTAVSLDPDCVEGMNLLALLASDAGRHRESEQLFLDALRIDAGNPALLLNYAILMHKTGHLEKAEKLLRASLQVNPEYSSAHSMLSLVLSEQKKRSAAKGHGRMGVSLNPDHDVPHAHLGATYFQAGHPFRARKHLREALRLDPTDKDVEELFIEADRATRWIGLPFYYWSYFVRRIPGKQYTVWGCVLLLTFSGRALSIPESIVTGILFTYVLIALYTWVATPLVKLWVKMRPPK